MIRWLLLVCVACGHPAAPAISADLAITHVTVIDAAAGARADQTVLVAGDRIVAVGTGTAIPPRARVIDGKGKFLIPGLWDMHVHTGPPELYAPMYLAAGVVGVRDMGGEHEPPVGNLSLPIEQLRAFRDRVRAHQARGPTMYLGGPMVDGDPASWPNAVAIKNPADVPAALDKVAARGADFIKVYGKLDRDVYLAIAADAKKRGLVFAGHLPIALDPETGSDSGQKSFEHLIGVWLACSSRRAELEPQLHGSDPKARLAALEAVLDTFDEKACAPLFEKLIANHTWQDPTLVQWSHWVTAADPANLTDPRLARMPASVREVWDVHSPFYWGHAPPEDLRRKIFATATRIVGAMYRAGVPILAGSDSGNPYVYPGDGLHEELALLVGAGLSPLDALRAATLSPAQYFGIDATHGTIAAGKVADLVLLEADPLQAITNTRRIVGVMHDGEWMVRDATASP